MTACALAQLPCAQAWLASMQIAGEYARSAAACSHQFSALRELHLVESEFDANGHALLCSIAAASGMVLEHLDLSAATPLQLDFLVDCHALRILRLTGISSLPTLRYPWRASRHAATIGKCTACA